MAERLTENDKYGNNAIFFKNNNFTIADDKEGVTRIYGNAVDKLAQFEDILEKYGIDSTEELDYYLEVFKKMRKQYGKLNQENCKNKKERDIWQKACELACENISVVQIITNNDIENNIDNLPKYFYEQAKEELENENKINIDKYKFIKEDFIKDFSNKDIRKFENSICKIIGIDNNKTINEIEIKNYDIMQDRDSDEKYSNGIWDLAGDLVNTKLDQESLYNYLQDFKELIINNLKHKE